MNYLKEEYNRRLRSFQILTGFGMKVYNTCKYGYSSDVYRGLMAHLINKDGRAKAVVGAKLPVYFEGEKTDVNMGVDILVNENFIIGVYSMERIEKEHRNHFINTMKLCHIPYGMLCNFDRTIFYSEWFEMDTESGVVDMVKLMK